MKIFEITAIPHGKEKLNMSKAGMHLAFIKAESKDHAAKKYWDMIRPMRTNIRVFDTKKVKDRGEW